MAPEHLHTNILDNLKTAILLVNPDLSINYINNAAEALLEVSGRRWVNEPITQLFNNLDNIEEALQNTTRHANPFTKRECQLVLLNEQRITVDLAVTPIFDIEKVSALLIELQPIDRLIRISREEGLLSSQQNSQALVRGLAHEIKNPLGGLRGAAQLLAKELPSKDLLDYTDVIIEEADRLSNLLDRMLGSHDLLDIKPVNVHEIIERVRSLVEAESGHSIDFIRDFDPSIPDLFADKERLIQATLNIVRNAMQALQNIEQSHHVITLKTRTLRQFTIGTLRHRLVCQIEINDNGPGIPSEIVDKIFLPMISGRSGGTGLGLSIAQSIINHHHGLIQCQSSPGNTTFYIYIPIQTGMDTTGVIK